MGLGVVIIVGLGVVIIVGLGMVGHRATGSADSHRLGTDGTGIGRTRRDRSGPGLFGNNGHTIEWINGNIVLSWNGKWVVTTD